MAREDVRNPAGDWQHGGSPEDVRVLYERHVAAVAADDVDAIVAGYGQDAVLIGPAGGGRGSEFVRSVFAAAGGILDDLQPETTVDVVGDVVLAVWHSGRGADRDVSGCDTFVFDDGLIVAHTSAQAHTRT
ncbi:nuclear transport factor 2 family protein [Jatrophihabitans endophyticus]|uniref:nuclear transport factor 2 family protein n=1 Tax=Jatrophihabitans endophyticus TaxID=1206085 RepID=UPI0019F80983|nr:nuclear transport factor 2 family protein [Jatrophihabitans endophyticus]MBE7189299.1 nuclear transport factor 2 family protein [Jatrophihabitans endophyticus]